MSPELLAAVAIGFAGAGHCIGMCGGISAALTLGVKHKGHKALAYSLAFNLGRILSYALIGALIGGLLGSLASGLQFTQHLELSLYFAGGMLMLMGLAIAQIWQGVRRIEVIGKGIWTLLTPLSKRLMPIQSLPQALALGLLWGWLPCGLIYSSLIWAASSADWQQSALLMLAFGVGTLPANLASGILAQQMKDLLRHQLSQRLLGLSMIILGLYTLPIWS